MCNTHTHTHTHIQGHTHYADGRANWAIATANKFKLKMWAKQRKRQKRNAYTDRHTHRDACLYVYVLCSDWKWETKLSKNCWSWSCKKLWIPLQETSQMIFKWNLRKLNITYNIHLCMYNICQRMFKYCRNSNRSVKIYMTTSNILNIWQIENTT